MKVVVVEFAGKGGMTHYVYQLCRAMAETGADVTLVTDKNHYELAALDHPFRVERIIDTWDPKPAGRLSMARWAVILRKLRRVTRAVRYYREWLRLIRRIATLRPDVVQLGDVRFAGDLLPLILLRRKTTLLADICHNVHPFSAGGTSGGLFDRSRFRRFFYRRIYRFFDVVFVHFDRNRDEFTSTFGVPAERTAVIVHGNEAIFEELRAPGMDGASLRRRLGIGAGERVVLFFGTLSRYKGTDVLLHAFSRVRQATGARLVLAGYPFHDFSVAAHEELSAQLGIAGSVTWVPEYIASEEVAAWMELADAIVFPYRDIYQSGALHVAQTFGLPIIASAIGAMRDVIVHEHSGLLVPPNDPDALADAIIRLLTDGALAKRLGDQAAADARSQYSWSRIAGIVLREYEARVTSVSS